MSTSNLPPPNLFEHCQLGDLTLRNRIVMAPMTRSRALQPGDEPTEINAIYYAQRASAGLIVSEAVQISPEGKGYAGTPGIYSDQQSAGWRLVTSAVHKAGGRIFAQLWHVGRVSTVELQPNGQPPVAPSAVAAQGTKVFVIDADGAARFVSCSQPRALATTEIPRIVDDYRKAAARSMEAGFDGVEIHAANGYLIDQFLRTSSNQREDAYGGSCEKRVRFLEEVTSAVTKEVGARRVGVRLSPFITTKDMADPEVLHTMHIALEALDAIGIAYVHIGEADWDDAPVISDDCRQSFRKAFSNSLIVAGQYTFDRAHAVLAAGYADLVAFGRPFIANPDLPLRLRQQLSLAAYEAGTLYGGNERGYTDYPPIGLSADRNKAPQTGETK